MKFSWKNTRKLLNPRLEKKRRLPSISDQIMIIRVLFQRLLPGSGKLTLLTHYTQNIK